MLMRKLLLALTLLAAASQAADFERINWRTQLYLQGEPAYLKFKADKDKTLLNDGIDTKLLTIPVSVGALWSPLITPFWKADIPFTLWLGLEVNSIQFGTIEDKPKYTFEDDNGEENTKSPKDDEELWFLSYAPSALAGFSFNLAGDFDLRVLGGYGFQFFTFYDEFGGNTKQHTEMLPTGFVSGALEYRIGEIFQDADFKIGINVRKEFLPYEKVKARSKDNSPSPSPYSDLKFDKIEYKWPVRVGLELSIDFGRESRRDRRMRYNLHDRDDVLRKYSEVKDTLSDWDCMAIERDYRFYLDENGELPDMSEAYTRTQFADVLESFLAFCHPADLATKEKLYSTLDSGKVQIKEYQAKQEDSRFDQVMASNDPEMLEMFLLYYPDSPRRAEVEAKLRSLSEYDKFRAIQAQNTFKAYLTYLNDNPNGAFRDEAEAGIFELVKAGNRLKDYEIYLKRFPNGKYVEEAKAALQQAKNGGAAPAAEEQSIIEYQTGESYSEPEQPAEEPAAEEEAVEEEQPAVQHNNSAAANKRAAKMEAKKKARQKQLEAKKARAAKKKKR
ncbi:hypothetical protein SAMN05720473_10248 [Fibrobacter sp. UWB15]|nr:hypothetical protein BGW99_10248 [Fibrobacter sp. UWB6]SHG35872.1 hypothetical protein SAMN05720760_10948 [Fibrobacter sp. UWB8]SMG19890.1 hypothetical protein SAMN05720473_10248 [Fibrobacter sp. UWB15]